MEFILCDSDINSRYGLRVLVDGIDTTQFERNPVMLYDHREYEKEDMPIGKWERVIKEGGVIRATADFDQSDKFAQKVEAKVKGGYIRMASVGLIPVEWSDDPKYKLEGQTGATLIKSILRESSITPFGANWNALKLYDKTGKILNLSDLDFNISNIKNETSNKMDIKQTLAAALNLSEKVSDSEMISTVITLSEGQKKLNAELKTATDRLEVLEAQAANADKEVLLSEAVKDKRITEKEKVVLLKLEIEDIKIALSERKAADNLPGLATGGATENPLLKLSYKELDRLGKLSDLKAADPDSFKVKFKEEYGVDYKE